MILLVYLACPAVRIREKGLLLLQHVPNHKHQCLFKINTQKYIFLNLYI